MVEEGGIEGLIQLETIEEGEKGKKIVEILTFTFLNLDDTIVAS